MQFFPDKNNKISINDYSWSDDQPNQNYYLNNLCTFEATITEATTDSKSLDHATKNTGTT